MRGHPWFLWRRQSIAVPVINNGDYRGFMPWFRYSLNNVAIGRVCIGTITMTIPGATFAMTIPSATLAMTAPSATIDIEDCP